MDPSDKAFAKVDRTKFVLPQFASEAGFDAPLPIGFGQTISQPTTVHRMLEWLEPQLGDKVLDVGSGSGWTTALLAYLVGPKGRVYAVERIPELMEFGQANCLATGVKNARFYLAGRKFGLPKFAPFDRILVSAADGAEKELLEQLKVGGKLVVPVRNDILEIEKTSDKQTETTVHPGYVFVPLEPGGQA